MEAVPPPADKATIADVARRAGVGVGSVSRVLNGSPLVSEAMRTRVTAVIDELEYHPSRLGRRLSLRQTLTVGVVVPFFTHPSSAERVKGIVSALAGGGRDVALFDVETPEHRDEHLGSIARGDRADGLLVVSLPLANADVALLARAAIPVVLVDTHHPGLPSVGVDDVEGGALAAAHLLELGHRRIAFVGDEPLDAFGFTSSNDRRRGYERTLRAAGLEPQPGHVRLGAHGRDVARRLAAELLGLPDPPSAIFAASDTQALGVLEAAADLDVAVPERLSVVGFDDLELMSFVGLTTVRQPLAASGAAGADLLLRALSGESVPDRVVLPVELVVRRTTARLNGV